MKPSINNREDGHPLNGGTFPFFFGFEGGGKWEISPTISWGRKSVLLAPWLVVNSTWGESLWRDLHVEILFTCKIMYTPRVVEGEREREREPGQFYTSFLCEIWVVLPNQGHAKITIWNWWSKKPCSWVMGFFIFIHVDFGEMIEFGEHVWLEIWLESNNQMIYVIQNDRNNSFFRATVNHSRDLFHHKKEGLPTTQVVLEGVRKDPYHIPLQFESLGFRTFGTLRTIGRSIILKVCPLSKDF